MDAEMGRVAPPWVLEQAEQLNSGGRLVPTGRDETRGIDLFPAPQRPTDAQGPEQHISMAGAEIHGHYDSCCCHALCSTPACHVPGAS